MKKNITIICCAICLGIITFNDYSPNHDKINNIIGQANQSETETSTEENVDNSTKSEDPIVDDKENLSLDMLTPSIKINELFLPDTNSETRVNENTHVVIHFSSNASNNQDNPYSIDDIYSIFEEYEVSSHYVIDRDGTVYSFVPESRVAYHAGKGTLQEYPEYENKLNHHSIGIELLGIGTMEEMEPIIGLEKFSSIDPNLLGFTDYQYNSLNLLLDDILNRNPKIKMDRTHIIGHDEYSSDKTDPGALFDWSKIGL